MSQTAPAGVDYPGKSLGIVGLVLSFFLTLIGSVLCFIAWQQSRADGYCNTPALVGVAIGAIVLTFWVVLIVVFTPLVSVGITGG